MALDQRDYGERFSRLSRIVMEQQSRVLPLLTRNPELEQAGANEVIKQDIQFGSMGDVTTRTGTDKGGAWPAANELDLHQITLTMDSELTQVDVIKDFDIRKAPIDLVAARAFETGNKHALDLDAKAAAYMLALSTDTSKPSAEDGSGVNGNAGPVGVIPTVGAVTANKRVGIDGDRTSATFGEAVSEDSAVTNPLEVIGSGLRKTFSRMRAIAEETYMANGVYFGGAPGELWISAHFRVILVLQTYFETVLKLPYPQLNEGILQADTPNIFQPGTNDYAAKIDGVRFVPQVGAQWAPAQTNAASKAAGWPIVFGTDRAIEYGIEGPRSLTIDTMQNQRNIQNERRSLAYWGVGLVNAPLLYRGIVASVDGPVS